MKAKVKSAAGEEPKCHGCLLAQEEEKTECKSRYKYIDPTQRKGKQYEEKRDKENSEGKSPSRFDRGVLRGSRHPC
jgi:hypothetical protein